MAMATSTITGKRRSAERHRARARPGFERMCPSRNMRGKDITRAPMISFRMAAAAALLFASAAPAAPNLPSDDPAWILLRDLRARGLLAELLGGQQTLGEDEVQRALAIAGLTPDARLLPLDEHGFWARPLERATLRAVALHEHDRPYSLDVRPRN